MSSEKVEGEIPQLRLTEIRLRSLSYRAIRAEPLLCDQSEMDIKGSIRYTFYGRQRKSFKVRATQEIKTEYATFRARQEARFTTDTPISDELLDESTFQKRVVNKILPFGSELFATLTSKTFDVPFITPGELMGKEEEED